MRCVQVAIVAILLFALTCVLCWVASFLLQFSPIYSIVFFLLGTLGVVLTIDILQEWLFG